MAGPVIAVADSVFASLDPAKTALSRLNATFRMSKSSSAEDILAVAKDADALFVTYAKITREIITQLTKCKAIGRFGLGTPHTPLIPAQAGIQLDLSAWHVSAGPPLSRGRTGEKQT